MGADIDMFLMFSSALQTAESNAVGHSVFRSFDPQYALLKCLKGMSARVGMTCINSYCLVVIFRMSV